MSRLNNPTNLKRVGRIMDTLGHLEVSIRSNRATPEEVAEITAPLAEWLHNYAAASPAPISEGPRLAPQDVVKGTFMDIRKAAEEASLSDLTYAMAVYLNRIDGHLTNKD